jgi:hypothetical protein
MFAPFGTTPGRYRSIGASSATFFSATSCRVSTATNVLVWLPASYWSLFLSRRCVDRSARPAVAVRMPSSPLTRVRYPTGPASTTAWADRCRSSDAAFAGGPVRVRLPNTVTRARILERFIW